MHELEMFAEWSALWRTFMHKECDAKYWMMLLLWSSSLLSRPPVLQLQWLFLQQNNHHKTKAAEDLPFLFFLSYTAK